jgi:hypothetical protein
MDERANPGHLLFFFNIKVVSHYWLRTDCLIKINALQIVTCKLHVNKLRT